MSRRCELLGKKAQTGNTVSNANNKNKTKFNPNLTWKRIDVPELRKTIRVKLSTRALRIIDKRGGLLNAARKYTKTISPKLEKLLREAS